MTEGKVAVVPRKPYGRRRRGGRKPRPRKLQFYPALRSLAERLAGPEWRTMPEIAELVGRSEASARARICEIGRWGSAEFVLRRSYSAGGADASVRTLRGGRRQSMHYQIERIDNHATE